MLARTHAHTYIRIHAHTHARTRTHVHTYIRIYTHARTHMHTRRRALTLPNKCSVLNSTLQTCQCRQRATRTVHGCRLSRSHRQTTLLLQARAPRVYVTKTHTAVVTPVDYVTETHSRLHRENLTCNFQSRDQSDQSGGRQRSGHTHASTPAPPAPRPPLGLKHTATCSAVC